MNLVYIHIVAPGNDVYQYFYFVFSTFRYKKRKYINYFENLCYEKYASKGVDSIFKFPQRQ